MAASRKVARKAARAPARAKVRALDPPLCEAAFQLRVKAATQLHSGTALDLRLQALEKLVTALIDAR